MQSPPEMLSHPRAAPTKEGRENGIIKQSISNEHAHLFLPHTTVCNKPSKVILRNIAYLQSLDHSIGVSQQVLSQ